MMVWNDERVELLKKLWAEGLSASQIAGRIGEVTRNAVIGKVHRLGLSGRVTTSRKKKGRTIQVSRVQPVLSRDEAEKQAAERRRLFAAAAEAALPKPVFVEHKPTAVALAVVPALVKEEDPAPTTSLGVSLLDLKESMCRYPIGDPQADGFHFCGARKAAGFPYCEKHVRVCLQPVQRRRPARPVIMSNELKLPELEVETL